MTKTRSGHLPGCSAKADAEIRRLRRRLVLLERQVQVLGWDEPFGMLTRNAFLQHCSGMSASCYPVAFIDLNDIGELNLRHGYTEVDRRIQAAFSIFTGLPDVVARWYSGDEIVILFDASSSPEVQMHALMRSARQHGLTFVHQLGAWDSTRGAIENTIQQLSAQNILCKRFSRKTGNTGGRYDESRVYPVGRPDGDVDPQRIF